MSRTPTQPPSSPHYAVQVLLPHAPVLVPSIIHSQLLAWRDDVELIGHAEHRTGHFGFAIPTGDLPLLVHIFEAAPDAYGVQLADALAWSPTWPERYAAIDACKASIVVSMVAHRAVNHATMLLAFLSVLDTVLGSVDDLRPAVLHWMPAQRVLAFATYRLLRMELGPCGPAVNVRIAAISEVIPQSRPLGQTASGPTVIPQSRPLGQTASGPTVMVVADTVGLMPLGLPDLQVVIHDRDPSEYASRLVGLARSMFVGDALDCPWIEEAAIVLPCRDALTVQLD